MFIKNMNLLIPDNNFTARYFLIEKVEIKVTNNNCEKRKRGPNVISRHLLQI